MCSFCSQYTSYPVAHHHQVPHLGHLSNGSGDCGAVSEQHELLRGVGEQLVHPSCSQTRVTLAGLPGKPNKIRSLFFYKSWICDLRSN